MINFACISPHPPMIVPTIGSKAQRQKVKKTTNSLEKLGEKLQRKNLDTLLIISPHLPLNPKKISIFANENFRGDLKKFRDFRSQFSYPGNPKLAKKLNKKLKEEGFPSKEKDLKKLDHGSLVPLYFLTQRKEKESINLIPIAFCDVNLKKHFKAGELVGKILKKSEVKIGVCASGDLSHRLKKGAPAGYSPKGEKFDKKLVKLLKEKKIEKIINLDEKLVQKAGECGLRSIVILLGILEAQTTWSPQVLSYQGPFGVGYLTANFRLS